MLWPEPIEEGAVRFSWVPSQAKKDRVKMTIEIDFGKKELTPSQAVATTRTLAATLRLAFGVELSEIR